MTHKKAKQQACLSMALQAQALIDSEYLIEWIDDYGVLTQDGLRMRTAIEEIRDELFRRGGDATARYVEQANKWNQKR